MKVFVVFGSASDKNVSQPLVTSLKRVSDDVEFQVISAHRNLEQLQERIKTWQGDAIIAGAGLAAALPGVVAAMTGLPVFGVPVPSQFAGLDSLASIAQMPPGVPVMTCGPTQTDEIVHFLAGWQGWKPVPHIHFVVPHGIHAGDDIAKADAVAKEKGITVTSGAAKDPVAFNVYFVTKADDVRPAEFCLHIPHFSKEDAARPEKYIDVLSWTYKGGLWVGVNNTRNAVQSLLRLMKGS